MSESIVTEAEIFLKSVGTGAILLAVYDVLQLFRVLIPHRKFLVGAEDVLFWMAAALKIFVMLYRENYGYLRAFSIGGVVLGMILYSGVGKALKKVLRNIGKTVRMGLCKRRKKSD